MVAPLTIYDSGLDGEITEAARNFWQNRFKGFGLWIAPFTNTHPSSMGFLSPNAFDKRHLATLKEYAELAKNQGVKAVVQIAHAGMHADPALTHCEVLAPSGDAWGRFRTMSDEEVREIVQSFAYAAQLVMEAGFAGVEIHGANGFLIQQFFSANSNLRTDFWGGSLEKRMNFPLEIIKAIDEMRKKHNRPDFIIGYRFSPEEAGARGITMKETLALIDALCLMPLQYLHISLWDFYKKVRRGADTNLHRVELVHKHIEGRLPFIASGNLYDAEDMLKAYNTGWVEFLSIGKSVLLNPNLIELIKSEKEEQIERQFDWDKADYYRYTPAMLQGTEAGTDFFPPSKQKPLRYKTEHF